MPVVYERLQNDIAARPASLVTVEAFFMLLINGAALLGNSLIFVVAYRNRRRLTVTDHLIVALSSTDLLVSVTVMPLSVGALITGGWPYNERICRFQGFCVITFATTSLNTLSLIAINRYYCIVKPNRYRTVFSSRNTIAFLGIVWFISLCFSIPSLAFGADDYAFQPGKAVCVYPFEINTAYTAGLDVVFIGVPTAAISFCYWRVYRTLSQRNRVMSEKAYRLNVREANITKTAGAVVLGFVFCWLPVLVIDVIDTVSASLILPRQLYLLYTFMVFLSSTINPIIYALVSRRFRKALEILLNGMCNRKRPSEAMGHVAH